ncbi:MAG: glucose-6-phosphate dehydrogenase assembly protein OpcA [Pseudomonadota bacterium]
MATAMTLRQSAAAKFHSLPPKQVRVADIGRELADLWKYFHQDVSGGKTVTLACMSNLMIFCSDLEQVEKVAREIPSIAQEHPARVLLLCAHADDRQNNDIESFVSLDYSALNGGWQVFSEQVRVIARGDAARRLVFVARSHLIGDLPTALWWASDRPPPEEDELFRGLSEMADQIIYDSIGWRRPARGILAMSRWVAAGREEYVIYNLSWRRLKPWRKLISQVLDPVVLPGALNAIESIEIEHGPHALAKAWLLLGWLACQLNWQPLTCKAEGGVKLHWRFQAPHGTIRVTVRRLTEGEPYVYRFQCGWRDGGDKQSAVFAMLADQRLGVVEDLSTVPQRVIPAPDLERADLVAAQLAHRKRDKLFENALNVANVMAGVLLG